MVLQYSPKSRFRAQFDRLAEDLTLADLVLGLSAKNLDSFERYCWSTFPFVLALAVATDRDEVERGAYVLAAAALVGYSTLAFLGIQGP